MNKKRAVLTAPLLCLSATVTWAAGPAEDAPDLIDVQTATCTQFMRTMSFARPPANPTEKQAAYAVLAQDDLVLAMTWMNGYLAGRDGAKGAKAFDKDWIVTHIGKVAAVCKANPGSMLLRDVAAKL